MQVNKQKSIFNLNSLGVIILCFFLVSCIIQYPKIKHAQSTIGTVGSYSSGKSGRGYSIAYYVKKKKRITYYYQTAFFLSNVVYAYHYKLDSTTKLVVTYNSKKHYARVFPNRNNFITYPIFNLGEETKKTTATITKITGNKHSSYIEYEYADIGMSWKYIGSLCTRTPKPNIKVRDVIPIEYSVQNPTEAILLVDSLIKDTTTEGLIYRHY